MICTKRAALVGRLCQRCSGGGKHSDPLLENSPTPEGNFIFLLVLKHSQFKTIDLLTRLDSDKLKVFLRMN